ncbi:LexA SOS-response transcriptional repressors (RecA-mediated autopeptidases) [uncultured Caudovirales phage]|uniref:LexA SOS-response transcriptional repressors (RecA-mediated autopeptidases) n=1 Tax=uncultured Caudovirales phage TaxID=2100421 RepID=A0A6J5M0M0_9CAUD|nr:LexA SOS-response transcriptional repressors (RecA-mediated autopeptidases) [uncultured Caudovirales phage]
MADFTFDPALVRDRMKFYGISQAKMARDIGLPSQSAFSNILNGTRKVTVQEAAAIYRILGITFAPEPNVTAIPIIGLANAGSWREAIQMPIGYTAVPNRAAGPKSFALEVSGDSMDLIIEDGGYVVVDPDRKELLPGKCYLIMNGEHEATVKMYQRDPSRFEPCSSNPQHQPFMASDKDFVIVGRVVWKGSPL